MCDASTAVSIIQRYVDAVSYTHRDVYKRQDFYSIDQMFEFPFSNESLTEPLLVFGEIQIKTEGVITVSYTHLDVYKRQSLQDSGRRIQ